MKNVIIIVIALTFLSACNQVKGLPFSDPMLTQKYVPGTEDLPIYTGFRPVGAKNIAYDSQSGRIVDASYTSSDADMVQVQKFYKDTLVQLGWKKNKPHLYTREGERLKISITSKNGITFLKFVIRPIA